MAQGCFLSSSCHPSSLQGAGGGCLRRAQKSSWQSHWFLLILGAAGSKGQVLCPVVTDCELGRGRVRFSSYFDSWCPPQARKLSLAGGLACVIMFL